MCLLICFGHELSRGANSNQNDDLHMVMRGWQYAKDVLNEDKFACGRIFYIAPEDMNDGKEGDLLSAKTMPPDFKKTDGFLYDWNLGIDTNLPKKSFAVFRNLVRQMLLKECEWDQDYLRVCQEIYDIYGAAYIRAGERETDGTETEINFERVDDYVGRTFSKEGAERVRREHDQVLPLVEHTHKVLTAQGPAKRLPLIEFRQALSRNSVQQTLLQVAMAAALHAHPAQPSIRVQISHRFPQGGQSSPFLGLSRRATTLLKDILEAICMMQRAPNMNKACGPFLESGPPHWMTQEPRELFSEEQINQQGMHLNEAGRQHVIDMWKLNRWKEASEALPGQTQAVGGVKTISVFKVRGSRSWRLINDESKTYHPRPTPEGKPGGRRVKPKPALTGPSRKSGHLNPINHM